MHPAFAGWLAAIEPVFLPRVRQILATSGLLVAAVAIVGAWLASTVVRGRVTAARGAVLLAALVVADLARVGAGMNPQVNAAFFERLPEMGAFHLDRLDGGRVFSYGVEKSPAFAAFLREGRPGRTVAAFFVDRQLLGPYTNVLDRVEAPEATDLTSFGPRPAELTPEDYDPSQVARLLPWLRNAAVSRVLSLDPLEHPDLSMLGEVPLGVGTLAARVYAVRDPAPRSYVACGVVPVSSGAEGLARSLRPGFAAGGDVALEHAGTASCHAGAVAAVGGSGSVLSYRVTTDGPGYLVTRDSYAPGWTATVDGSRARVLRANGKHRAVAVPEGTHDVTLAYHPPGLGAGLAFTLAAAACAVVLWARPVAAGAPRPAREAAA
jgi:hypothetical protein